MASVPSFEERRVLRADFLPRGCSAAVERDRVEPLGASFGGALVAERRECRHNPLELGHSSFEIGPAEARGGDRIRRSRPIELRVRHGL